MNDFNMIVMSGYAGFPVPTVRLISALTSVRGKASLRRIDWHARHNRGSLVRARNIANGNF